MNQTQTPMEEAAERIAEGLPGLGIAAKAVGLQDHQRMLAEHAKRVRESHVWMAKQSGATVADEPMSSELEEMGNITITGDISVADQAQLRQILDRIDGNTSKPPAGNQDTKPASPNTTSGAPEQMAAWKQVLGALTIAATTAGATAYLLQPSPAPPSTDKWIEYDVEKWIPSAEDISRVAGQP